ncbi:hypothetical protein EON63_19795 [archaeon]|nr:MAG: hypothetical protein EON63_19795 [archaeon]
MSGKHYVTEPVGYLEPKVAESGVAAWPAKTVIELFQTTVERFPNEPALLYKRPEHVSYPHVPTLKANLISCLIYGILGTSA